MSGNEFLELLNTRWFMAYDDNVVTVLAKGRNFTSALSALDMFEDQIATAVTNNHGLILDHSQRDAILGMRRFWKVGGNAWHGLIDEMLERFDEFPSHVWRSAISYVPACRVKVATRLLASDLTLHDAIEICKAVPEKAEEAWSRLWSFPKDPPLVALQKIAEANPAFRSRVGALMLKKYPRGQWSRASLAWVKKYGTAQQKRRAQEVLDTLNKSA